MKLAAQILASRSIIINSAMALTPSPVPSRPSSYRAVNTLHLGYKKSVVLYRAIVAIYSETHTCIKHKHCVAECKILAIINRLVLHITGRL
jgi:hypothetical protein